MGGGGSYRDKCAGVLQAVLGQVLTEDALRPASGHSGNQAELSEAEDTTVTPWFKLDLDHFLFFCLEGDLEAV